MAHSAPDAGDGKAVLHCPRCGYRGKWTDWSRGPDGHTLRCPSCEAAVG